MQFSTSVVTSSLVGPCRLVTVHGGGSSASRLHGELAIHVRQTLERYEAFIVEGL